MLFDLSCFPWQLIQTIYLINLKYIFNLIIIFNINKNFDNMIGLTDVPKSSDILLKNVFIHVPVSERIFAEFSIVTYEEIFTVSQILQI